MTAGNVSVTRDGEVATVTIDRAERSNALDAATAAALKDAIEGAADARVTILTGAGKAFCAGGDLEELEKWSGLDRDAIASHLYGSFQGAVRAIRASDSIVIAAVNGAAVGAGMDIALACDLRIAGASARFGEVWVGLGVIPGTGGAFLAQHLAGPTVAAELLLTGEIIDARTALNARLVNEVTEDDKLIEAARAMADRILKHPRDGVIANKRAYVAVTQPAMEAALEHAAQVQPERFTSAEFKEQLQARLKKS
jgi:2-(1,2-epoxy-1,2-dihydrophenyl)acetyl-CoA isomerase